MRLLIQDRYATFDTGRQDFPSLASEPDDLTLLNVKDETTLRFCESKTNVLGRPEVKLTMRELWTLLETYQATRQETTPHEG